ncbi:DnaA N-terminal domain-containing protein [Rickettsia endosymbiont of Ixodes scapularis]|uniref:DnaA N-terminal domain-containing protein n=1 Tax=Rickettsia endosymbiont of Ixodes scapularis TaxID=444612 RepID=UPI0002EF20CA|nr:DnaA N-terminal domain-containing protein [Rickettsia endosymbiont of Ixodes scapularis]
MQLFYPLGLPSDNIGIRKHHDATKNPSQSYIPITGCVLSHILSSKELSSLEKMYYILTDSLSCINSSKGRNRSVSLPAKGWAERLACSKSEVFVLQKSLEDKGYFIIHRDKNDKGQNNRNIITTTIPTQVFNDLKYEPDRFNLRFDDDIDDQVINNSQSYSLDSIDKTFIPTLEGKRQHLDKTKMFIRVPYQFLKQLNSNCSISATSKIVLLYLFTKIYKSSANKYDHDGSGNYGSSVIHNPYSIVISYQELQVELKLHRNSLTKALMNLEEANLINRDQIVIKNDDDYNNRADKSLWRISLLSVFVTNDNKCKKQQYIDHNQACDTGVNQALESLKDKGCTKYDPPCTDSGQLYIKDFILNNSINRNIDYIDVNHLNFKNLSVNNSQDILRELPKTENTEINHKEEFLEDKQDLSSSEFYNNSPFSNDSFKKTLLKKNKNLEDVVIKSAKQEILGREIQQQERKEVWQELRHFYPLSERDISLLNSRANREFSNNFVNQLLLKLYIKYPEKRFKNKFTFSSYMVQILKNEKHQGPLVNHTNFRFSCNIGQEEKNLLEYEKYLSAIENSFDTSKEMCVKKKIAGRFNSDVAYKILTGVEFRTNQGDSFITALIPSHLDLSDRQIEILSEQLEAVYGINGYYVQEVEDVEDFEKEQERRGKEKEMEILYPKITKSTIVSNSTPVGILERSGGLDAIEENTAWHQIRSGLIEELGYEIDRAWFSKARVKEDKEMKTLTISMPTKFMADWLKNQYGHIVYRLSSSLGFNFIEYYYDKLGL